MRDKIVDALKAALDADHGAIWSHISDKWEAKSTGGVEKAFSDAFLKHLPPERFNTEVLLTGIGGQQLAREGIRGFMDCVIDGNVGLEFKAMRLPRKIKSGADGARYDLGQIVEDYIRIREAKLLTEGYTVVFVYGPLVADAETQGQLYRAFHNQLFLDHSVAQEHRQTEGPEWQRHREIIEELEFNKPLEGFAYDRNIIVVKHGALGAIAMPRDWE